MELSLIHPHWKARLFKGAQQRCALKTGQRAWRTGTTRIIRLCREQGLPEPEFANWQGGVRVIFLQDPYTPERLRKMGLNERQIKAVLNVKKHGEISNREYRRLTGVSDETARQELMALVKRNLLQIQGRGRATRYVLGTSDD